MRTRNQEEALKKAKELLPVIKSDNLEVISTHVKVAKNLAQKQRSLPLNRIWEVYSTHPDKATPATVHEELSYQATLQEFISQLDSKITQFSQITAAIILLNVLFPQMILTQKGTRLWQDKPPQCRHCSNVQIMAVIVSAELSEPNEPR